MVPSTNHPASTTLAIPLSELLLRPSTLQRFTKRGFESTEEIEESRAHGGINLLASELDVSLQEAAGLIREVQACLESYYKNNLKGGNDRATTTEPKSRTTPLQHDEGIVTAYEWLHQQRKNDSRRHIVTFCRSIDDLLGGGIEVGQVTELSGLPGTGKTQLATQLAVLARLPHAFGGVQGRSLYVDAEGSFVPERAYAMARALCQHVQGTAQRQEQRKRKHKQHETTSSMIPADFTTEGILASIDVFRVHDEAALLATLYSLEKHIEKHSRSSLPVKLVVVDSIAFHFRAITPTDSSYYLQRTKTLAALALYLGDLARRYELAVVVVNQMTTKIHGGSSSVVPALGESWAHATSTRLLLSQEHKLLMQEDDDDDNDDENIPQSCTKIPVWTCTLVKSAHRPNGTADYRILEEGIRDRPPNNHHRKRPRTSR